MSEHELIIPDRGFPFKIFEFEGKGGKLSLIHI